MLWFEWKYAIKKFNESHLIQFYRKKGNVLVWHWTLHLKEERRGIKNN